MTERDGWGPWYRVSMTHTDPPYRALLGWAARAAADEALKPYDWATNPDCEWLQSQ